ncbi:hypothetical protein BD779DRAFT_1787322 [Infundibulicybe gibba]|nr:hypothetical protein BD779DRAFT_1787322 [Infundibulicybe gibba]
MNSPTVRPLCRTPLSIDTTGALWEGFFYSDAQRRDPPSRNYSTIHGIAVHFKALYQLHPHILPFAAHGLCTLKLEAGTLHYKPDKWRDRGAISHRDKPIRPSQWPSPASSKGAVKPAGR